jgi:hypothetical protein
MLIFVIAFIKKIMLNITRSVFTGVALAILFGSCSKKDNIPAGPVLTFNSFTSYLNINSGQDSAILSVNFTDGNGDIGYIGEPQTNFFVKMLWDSSGYIKPFGGNSIDSVFSYQIPNITPAGNNKQLTGIIKVNMNPWIPSLIVPYVKGDTILFDAWLVDRSGIKSNILKTPMFVIP